MTSHALWFAVAKTFAFACTIALPMLLTRRLSPTGYGEYKQVFLIIGTATIILPLGFGMSAFYFLPRERERQGQVIFNILLFNVIVGGLACLALVTRPTLLALIFGGSEMVGYAPLIGVAIMLWIVSAFLEVAPIANEEMRLASLLVVATQLSKTFLLLAAALTFNSVRAILWAAIAQGLLQTVLLFFYLRSRWSGFWRRFDFSILRAQLAYALPLGSAGLLYTLQSDLHYYVVSNRYEPDVYAVYTIGCFQLPLVWILAEAVGSVMIPRVSHLQRQGERREIVLLTARAMRKLAAAYFPLCAFLLVMGREFIAFLFTPRYLDAWPVFAINLMLLPLGVFIYDPIIRAFKEQNYFLLKLRFVLFAGLLVALWFGTHRFGLLGAIGSVVAMSLIERLIIVVRMGRMLGVTRRDWVLLKDTGKLLMAAALAGAATIFVRSLVVEAKPFFALAVCGVAFSLVYLLAIWLFEIISLDERDAVRSRIEGLLRFTPWKRAADHLT